MKYQVIFLICCVIRNSSQSDDNICSNISTGRLDVCCYNFEWTDGMCKECKIGTTTTVAGGRCMLCQKDTYGYKCVTKCVCDQSQRCDAKVGCVPKTSITTIQITYTGKTLQVSPMERVSAKAATVVKNGPIEPALHPNERVITNQSTVIKNGTSNADWIIYTLCISSCFFLTGFGHLFRTYRKRRSLKIRIINGKVVSKPLTPYMGDFSEVDKTPVTFVTTGSNVTPQAFHNETINFVFHERQSNTTCNEDDEAGYFDLYFAMNEDVNHQVENHALRKESLSTSSFNSNVVSQDNTEFHKPLQEYCQEDSHACEVSVTVHERQSNTACNEDDEDDEAGYFDLYFAVKEDVNHQVENHALRK